MRLEDFVNELAIRKLVDDLSAAFELIKESYVLIQNDEPEAWSLGTTLSYIGLKSRPAAKAMSPEDASAAFAILWVERHSSTRQHLTPTGHHQTFPYSWQRTTLLAQTNSFARTLSRTAATARQTTAPSIASSPHPLISFTTLTIPPAPPFTPASRSSSSRHAARTQPSQHISAATTRR